MTDRIKSALIPALNASSVLALLEKLQSELDATDISAIAQLFSAEHPGSAVFEPSAAVLADPTPEELRAFLTKYQAAGTSIPALSLREQIVSYALSAIFKDGSIMVRSVIPAAASASTAPASGIGGATSTAKAAMKSTVKLLDLDLKPLKMKAWYELDEKLWRHWLDTHPTSTYRPRSAPDDTTASPAAGSAAEAMRGIAQSSTNGVAPLSPTSPAGKNKPKFTGRLDLAANSTSGATVKPLSAGAVEANAMATGGPAGAQTLWIPATPAVEMTLEDVLSLSPAKLKAKPGQKAVIVEDEAEASTEALNGHGHGHSATVVSGKQLEGQDGHEAEDVLGKLEELVIDSPIGSATVADRRVRSTAPSPSPGPGETLSSGIHAHTETAAGTNGNASSARALGNGYSHMTEATPHPEIAVEEAKTYAAPPTPTFGTAQPHSPAGSPTKAGASQLSLSPEFRLDRGAVSPMSGESHELYFSQSEDTGEGAQTPPTVPPKSESAPIGGEADGAAPAHLTHGSADRDDKTVLPVVPRGNHDLVHVPADSVEPAPHASVGEKGVAEAKLEAAVHKAEADYGHSVDVPVLQDSEGKSSA